MARAETAGSSSSGWARSSSRASEKATNAEAAENSDEHGEGDDEREELPPRSDERPRLEPEAQGHERDQPIHERSSRRTSAWTSLRNTSSSEASPPISRWPRMASSEPWATILPPVDDRHLVAQPLHHVEHVRGEEEGDPAGGQAAQEVAHHAAGHGVDAVQGLVEEEHLRPVDEGAGEGELLAHALRVVHHELAALVGQGEELEELLRPPTRLGAREPVHPRGEEQVLFPGQPLVERQLLGEDADPPLEGQEVPGDPGPVDDRVARGGAQEAGEHPDRRALAGPVRAEESEEAPAGHAEGHVVDRHLAAERLREPLDHDRVGVVHQGKVIRFVLASRQRR